MKHDNRGVRLFEDNLCVKKKIAYIYSTFCRVEKTTLYLNPLQTELSTMKKNTYLSLLSLSSFFLCTLPCAAQPTLLKTLFLTTALLSHTQEGAPSAWTRRETTDNILGYTEIDVKGFDLTGLTQGDVVFTGHVKVDKETGNLARGGSQAVYLAGYSEHGVRRFQKLITTAGLDKYRPLGYAAVEATADGGFLAAGYIKGYGDQQDILVVKHNANGGVLWAQRVSLGGGLIEMAADLGVYPDGSFVVGANVLSKKSRIFMLVMRFNATGGPPVWTTALKPDESSSSENKNFAMNSLDLSPKDDEIVIAGMSDYNHFQSVEAMSWLRLSTRDASVFRLTREGRYMWGRYIGGVRHDSANDIVAHPDGGSVVVGRLRTALDSPHNVFVYAAYYAGIDTPDYVKNRLGDSLTTLSCSLAFFVEKHNANGDTEWVKAFGYSDFHHVAYGVTLADNGDIGVTGASEIRGYTADPRVYNGKPGSGCVTLNYGGVGGQVFADSPGDSDGFFMKLNATGGFKFMNTYGFNNYIIDYDEENFSTRIPDQLISIMYHNDAYYMVGSTQSYSTDNSLTDMLLVKARQSGTRCSDWTSSRPLEEQSGYDKIIDYFDQTTTENPDGTTKTKYNRIKHGSIYARNEEKNVLTEPVFLRATFANIFPKTSGMCYVAGDPTPNPTTSPTVSPTMPTLAPSHSPTAPTDNPTTSPTPGPTMNTSPPSSNPSRSPIIPPTPRPSLSPLPQGVTRAPTTAAPTERLNTTMELEQIIDSLDEEEACDTLCEVLIAMGVSFVVVLGFVAYTLYDMKKRQRFDREDAPTGAPTEVVEVEMEATAQDREQGRKVATKSAKTFFF